MSTNLDEQYQLFCPNSCGKSSLREIMSSLSSFKIENGIFVPRRGLAHQNEEYDESGFDLLMNMQRDHFWYRGRHELLFNVLKKERAKITGDRNMWKAIDMGGGCGGWIEYLHMNGGVIFDELALGDSSMRALSLAGPGVGTFAARYLMDIRELPWSDEWDAVFLLDVLEHIPDQLVALHQIRESMRTGGLLFVTVPALQCFWSYNDEVALHQRRYCRKDIRILAEKANLRVLRLEYFMFFLSPLLVIERMLFQPPRTASLSEKRQYQAKSHRIPKHAINEVLKGIFLLEAAAINSVRFPFGTSLLAVLQR